MVYISIVDWGIWVVYLTLILLVLWVYRSAKKDEGYRYFIPAFLIKVIGGLGFALVYLYYYGFGDTFLYHHGATVLSQTLIDAPTDYFRLLFSESANLPADLSAFSESIRYSNTYEEWLMVKLLSPINLISFQSYLVTTLFMSLLSFIGGWKLYRAFSDILPKYKKYVFWVVFLIPSVVFWGGGIMKDTVTLFGINYIIYALYFGLFKGSFKVKMLVSAIFVGALVVALKAYIVLAFLPGLMLGFYRHVQHQIKGAVFRFLAGRFCLLG